MLAFSVGFVLAILPAALTRRNYLSSNSFLDVDLLTSRAPVYIRTREPDGVDVCSGTLISSNLVYTAAHCVHRRTLSSMEIILPNNTISYTVADVYYPQEYKNYTLYWPANKRFCGKSFSCGTDCAKSHAQLSFYGSHFDYGLIRLNEHVPICTKEYSPVAAVLQAMLNSEDGVKCQPSRDKTECFVAGFGRTENREAGKISLAIISEFEGFTEESCGDPISQGVVTRFHTSNESNSYETEICGGDSGSGIQCISKRGRQLTVIGVNTKGRGPGITRENACRKPHESISLSLKDHVSDLAQAVYRWGEADNYRTSQQKCSSFLEENNYESVMHRYLNRPAEF